MYIHRQARTCTGRQAGRQAGRQEIYSFYGSTYRHEIGSSYATPNMRCFELRMSRLGRLLNIRGIVGYISIRSVLLLFTKHR
jgi:hypothetical protein